MIAVTDLVDRQQTRIGHLGRNGAIPLPRALAVRDIAGVALGALAGVVLLGVVSPFGLLINAAIGGFLGWIAVSWSPDEISANIWVWLLRRLRARQNRVSIPCPGAGSEPAFPAPAGGRCAQCDRDRGVDEHGRIVSCGFRARVYVGLAPIAETMSGQPVTFGSGLEDEPVADPVAGFGQRNVS